MSLHPSEDAFLEALAAAKDSWLQAAVAATAEPSQREWSELPAAWTTLAARLSTPEERDALRSVLDELLSGLTHSILVTLDGGSALAETTTLAIQDLRSGVSFKTFLHEFWPSYKGQPDA